MQNPCTFSAGMFVDWMTHGLSPRHGGRQVCASSLVSEVTVDRGKRPAPRSQRSCRRILHQRGQKNAGAIKPARGFGRLQRCNGLANLLSRPVVDAELKDSLFLSTRWRAHQAHWPQLRAISVGTKVGTADLLQSLARIGRCWQS